MTYCCHIMFDIIAKEVDERFKLYLARRTGLINLIKEGVQCQDLQ